MNKLDYLLGLVDGLEVVNEMLMSHGLYIKTHEFYSQYYMMLDAGNDDLALCEPEIDAMRKRAKALVKGRKKERLQ